MTTVLEGVEGSASRPDRSLPRKRPGTQCTGGWVGPRPGLDRCGKSRPHRDSIPGPSSPKPVAIPTELPGPQCIHSPAYISCCFSSPSKRPNHPWFPLCLLFNGAKAPGPEEHHSFLSSFEVRNNWMFTSAPLVRLFGLHRNSFA